MSNELAMIKLPAHLQALAANTALASINVNATKGISVGGWPRISIKGGYFRLKDPQGPEVVVQDRHLDIVLVSVNPHGLSKIYYEGSYDPNGDELAPACYSDNGVGPSSRAAKPQCSTCAACPHNVWGSRVTPAGAQVKACSDVKKVAVLIADNTSGPVFEFRIPAASLSNFAAYIRGLDAAGIPAASIITRVTFDTSSDFPKLLFAPLPVAQGASPYITAEMLADVMEVINSEEVKLCTGEGDKPAAVNAPPAKLFPLPNAPVAIPPVVQPLAVPQQVMTAPAEPAKRTRRRKVEAEPTQTAAAPADPMAPPPFLNKSTGRDAVAPTSVPASNAQLDDLIAKAMQV